MTLNRQRSVRSTLRFFGGFAIGWLLGDILIRHIAPFNHVILAVTGVIIIVIAIIDESRDL